MLFRFFSCVRHVVRSPTKECTSKVVDKPEVGGARRKVPAELGEVPNLTI